MTDTSQPRERSLRRRLIVTILVMSLVPTFLATGVSYFLGRASLERTAYERLAAIRDTRAARVGAYFETIRDLTVTLANSRLIEDAAEHFSKSFPALPEAGAALGIDQTAVEAAVRAYYTRKFGVEHRRQSGKAADVEALMPTDAAQLWAQYLYIATNPRPLGSKHLFDRPPGDNTEYGAEHASAHKALRDFQKRFGFYDIFIVDAATHRVVYSVFKEIDFGSDLRAGPFKDSGLARAARKALDASAPDASFAEDYAFYTPSYEAPAAFIAAPIFRDKSVIGALALQFPLDRINAVVNEKSGLGEAGECYLVGEDLLMHTDGRFAKESVVLRQRVDSRATRLGLQGVTGHGIETDYHGREVLVSYAALNLLGHKHALVTALPTDEALAAVGRLFRWMAGLTLVLALAALLIAFRVADTLARPIGRVTQRLQAMAESMLSTSQEQQAGAAEQSAAAEETRRTFTGLLDSASAMSTVGRDVLGHAEVAQRSAQSIGGRIEQLAGHTAHISEVLALVKEIANKSEILALNAALEGTKAGEAGRGFALVATQMQRLAEQVMGSAKKIEGLTTDIGHASQGAVLAAEEAEKVSRLTTDSASRISASASEQQAGAEQVSVAMDEISSVAHDNVEAARRMVSASNELLALAEGLRQSVGAKDA